MLFPRFPSAAFLLFACALALAPAAAPAQGKPIVVSGEALPKGKQSISLGALRGDGSDVAALFLSVLRNDLQLSGWFVPTDNPGGNVSLAGSVRTSAAGLSANVTATWLAGTRTRTWSREAPTAGVRDAAHAVADSIVADVAGKKPMASSRILFVGRRAGAATSEIYACDADGARPSAVTSDRTLCLSPNWNPGANSFMYTTWATGRPTVRQVDLGAGRYDYVSWQPGMNQGAVKNPRTGATAIVLSRAGMVDLYLLDPATHRVADRLTRSRESEASPSWSPDGASLAYVSDAGGVPRVYTMSLADRQPRRLVYDGSIRESVAPEWGPDGRIAFCGRSGARYRVYVVDPAKSPAVPVALSPDDGTDYEDPSWAPDGRHVVCTRTAGHQRFLVVLDTLGDPPRTIRIPVAGDWYLPSWSDNGVRTLP
ncbi:MAG: PD40 domain-containing protein [Kiritimatiellae bacterium]|nr:PD40 domain-containing protein [Kiritimatiellia bacterium]